MLPCGFVSPLPMKPASLGFHGSPFDSLLKGTSFPVPSKLNNVDSFTLCTDLRTLLKKSSLLKKSP